MTSYSHVYTYPSLYSSIECYQICSSRHNLVWWNYFWTRSFSPLSPGDPAVLTWILVFTFSVCMPYVLSLDANSFTAFIRVIGILSNYSISLKTSVSYTLSPLFWQTSKKRINKALKYKYLFNYFLSTSL